MSSRLRYQRLDGAKSAPEGFVGRKSPDNDVHSSQESNVLWKPSIGRIRRASFESDGLALRG